MQVASLHNLDDLAKRILQECEGHFRTDTTSRLWLSVVIGNRKQFTGECFSLQPSKQTCSSPIHRLQTFSCHSTRLHARVLRGEHSRRTASQVAGERISTAFQLYLPCISFAPLNLQALLPMLPDFVCVGDLKDLVCTELEAYASTIAELRRRCVPASLASPPSSSFSCTFSHPSHACLPLPWPQPRVWRGAVGRVGERDS